MHGRYLVGMAIGIIILITNILIVIGALVWRIVTWKRSRPTVYVRDVGVRYDKGSISPLPHLECIINGLYDRIGAKYGQAYAKQFLSGVIVEIVPANGVRVCPTAVVSQASRIAGSIDSEAFMPLPFFRRYQVAVVLQTPIFKSADTMAISHEIVKHILPMTRGEGVNADHSRQDLNVMSDGNDDACH